MSISCSNKALMNNQQQQTIMSLYEGNLYKIRK